MPSFEFLVISSLGLFLAIRLHAILRSSLLSIVGPMAELLARRGKRMLANPRLPGFYKDIVLFMLENATNTKIMNRFVWHLPSYHLKMLVSIIRGDARENTLPTIADEQLRHDYISCKQSFFLIMLCASPFASLGFHLLMLFAVTTKTSLENTIIDLAAYEGSDLGDETITQ